MRFRFPDSRVGDDSGTVTAEFAVVFPAVVLILGCALGAIGLGGEQLRLQGAAFDAARLLGRGDPGALERIHAVAPDARLGVRSSGALVCADVAATTALGVLSGIVLKASACALDDARQ
jgi:hypothetical protein